MRTVLVGDHRTTFVTTCIGILIEFIESTSDFDTGLVRRAGIVNTHRLHEQVSNGGTLIQEKCVYKPNIWQTR